MGAAGAAPGPAVIPGAAGERHARLVEQFERGRRERAVVVPTAPAAVIAQLRALGEPATLFGEAPVDRRGRLRGLLASLDAAGGGAVGVLPGAGEAEAEAEAAAAAAAPAVELFYTEGGEKLQEWRTRLAEFSLARAGHRLGAERARWEGPAAAEEAERFRTGQAAAVEAAGRVALVSSELSGERPASSCAFADDGSFLATCTWAGALQVWRVNGGGAGGRGGGARAGETAGGPGSRGALHGGGRSSGCEPGGNTARVRTRDRGARHRLGGLLRACLEPRWAVAPYPGGAHGPTSPD